MACALPQVICVDPPLPPRDLSAVDDLAMLVMGYLREHPHATDTLSGIAEWWVVRQQIRVDLENLERALEMLTERGVLEVSGSGPNRRYRLAKPAEPAEGA
jgi:hypothetical protein